MIASATSKPFDPISAKLIDDIGVETMMWGSDYPHTDGIWPESTKYIEEQFAGLSPEIVETVRPATRPVSARMNAPEQTEANLVPPA